MPAYLHLLDEERDHIAVIEGGRLLDLRRHALPPGRYLPLHAAGADQLRRRREAILEKDPTLRTFVRDRLAEGWTPNRMPDGSRPGAVCLPGHRARDSICMRII
jgi:hypothetical protein